MSQRGKKTLGTQAEGIRGQWRKRKSKKEWQGLGSIEAELGHDKLDVGPSLLFFARTTQQISRMISYHGWNAVVFVPLAAKGLHRLFGFQKLLGSDSAKAADDARGDDLNLLFEIADALGDLAGDRIAVVRGAALEDVANVDVVAGQAHTLGDDVVEEFSGSSDEGEALLVLVVAGGFADKDQMGSEIAAAKNGVGAGLVKGALGAGFDFGFEGFKSFDLLVVGRLGWGRGTRDVGPVDGQGLGAQKQIRFELLNTGS